MRKVRNWSIISAVFGVAGVALVATPVVALAAAGMALTTAGIALMRYEEVLEYKSAMSGR